MHSPSRNTGKRTICVFCGSSTGRQDAYAEAARKTGTLIAARGFQFLFGGGGLGLMGESARAARDGGVPVIGILPDFLRLLEPPLKSAEEVVITPDLYQRKDKMIAMSDAFIVLPGGLGTLDEFFEVVTSAQLHVHDKPIVLLDVNGYWQPLMALLRQVAREGFAREEIFKLFHVATTPEAALDCIDQAFAEAANTAGSGKP